MTAAPLPPPVATRIASVAGLIATRSLEHAGSLAALVEADAYPRTGILRIEGLRAGRHYRLQGTAQRFCRTDPAGTVRIELAVAGPTLLLLTPVI